MASLKREHAEWIAEFIGTPVQELLVEFDIGGGDAAKPGAAPAGADGEPGPDGGGQQPAAAGGGTADRGGDKADASGAGAPEKLADDNKVGFGPALPAVVVIAGVQYLTRELDAKVTITNSTDQTLTLAKGGVKFASGELKGAAPKPVLAPNESTSFTARSKSLFSFLSNIPLIGPGLQKALDGLVGNPSLSGVEATVSYVVGSDDTAWNCHFTYPRLFTSSKEASGTVTGPNPAGVKDASQGAPSDEDWQFVLSGKGGGGGGGPAAAAVTVRVTVNNQSDQTIFLRKQDNIGGEFITNPKTSLPAGQSDSFMYGAAANDKDRACRGKLFYDVADPKIVEWELMWDNRVTMKNISASFLNPANNTSGLHTLDQIDNGDENVPATFTLSGKGGGSGPPPAQATVATVTVDNKSDTELTLSSSSPSGGKLTPQPPGKLAAGASASMQFALDPDAKAGLVSMVWAVGDTGTSWFAKGTVPAQGDASADATLNPASATLSSQATPGKAATGPTLAYALSGSGGGGGAEEKFAPPPKTKQPTLRVGDDNADGWVEYAQQQINRFKLGPDLPVDGNFSKEMDARVKLVQHSLHCKEDGVIGNETWSALREGPREQVGTDGRKPHTFEEKGPQARFFTEASDDAGQDENADFYTLTVVSTGEQPIDKFSATVQVTQPSGAAHTQKVKIGAAFKKSPDGQGDLHAVDLQPFSKLFKLEAGIKPDMCTIDAYLDGEIGGDRLTIPPKAKPK